MNVVSFYAPRPDHKYFQDYTPFLDVLRASCEKFGHRHIVITDDPSIPDGFLVDLPADLMRAILVGQLAYLKSDLAKEDSILLGADCVLANDPAEIFAEPIDLACTTHPFTDCILNTGAIFVRGGVDAARIWEIAAKICGTTWGDDQLSLAATINPTLKHGDYIRHGLRTRFLPVDPWNLAPDYPGHDCSHAKILHFRGDRKRWLVDYCAKRLGIGKPIEAIALCNLPDDEIRANIRINGARSLDWVKIEPENDGHAVIVGGGPSLTETFREIEHRAQHGQVVFALNGAAEWLSSRGLMPDYQIVIDPRADNVKFVKSRSAKAFILASQCDPSLFDELSAADVTVVHCAMENLGSELPLDRDVTMIGGGLTSGLTAMALVFTLGYRQIHLYGYDSSDRDGTSHPYEQSETSAEQKRLEVWCGAQRFYAGFAMYKQAEMFPQVAQSLADEGATITVHGDGLLPAVARDMVTAIPIAEQAA